MKPVARVALGLGLAGASALMLHFSMPPYGIWPLALVGFVPMLVAKYRVMPRGLSSIASAVGIGGWFALWMVPVFGGSGTWMLWLPLGIFALTLVMDRGDRAFHERTGWRWFALRGALDWVGIEMIRGLVPVMGTWGFVGHALYRQAWLIQPVSLVGIFGLDLLVLLANCCLGLGAIAVVDRWGAMDPRAPSPPAPLVHGWLLGAAAAMAAWTAASLVLYPLPRVDAPTARVAAIQVPGRNAAGGYEKDPARRAALHRELAERTREAAGRGAEIVVWPEGSLDFDPAADPGAWLRPLAAETRCFIVIGYLVELEGGGWRNEAVVLSPSGEFSGRYGKDHPVLFGGERGTRLGTYPVQDTPAGRLGTIICYDLDFTDTARKLARGGAQLVAVPSLDWPTIAGRHSAHLVFRAVENGVAMVKADGGYDSVIVDPRGRIVAEAVTPRGSGAALVADVAVGRGSTLSTLLGDYLGWTSLAGFAFFAVYAPLSARRPRRGSGGAV